MKDRIYQFMVYLFALTILWINLSACGQQTQQSTPVCLSTGLTFLYGAFFPLNNDGIFVPDGWKTDEQTNSCNQIMNGKITDGTNTVIVKNGIASQGTTP